MMGLLPRHIGTPTPPFQDLKKKSWHSQQSEPTSEGLLCRSTEEFLLGMGLTGKGDLLLFGWAQKDILIRGLCHSLALLGAQHHDLLLSYTIITTHTVQHVCPLSGKCCSYNMNLLI